MLANYDIFKDKDNNCYQIRSKTSTYIVVFDDEVSEKIFLKIVEISSNNKNVDLQKLRKELATEFSEEQVIAVLHNL